LVLARATARARWTLLVTRYVSNSPTEDVSNCRAQDGVRAVAVSHDGQWVASMSDDCGVQFWDAKSGIVQLMLKAPKDIGPVSPRSIRAPWTDSSSVLAHSINFSPVGSLLATGSDGGEVCICRSRYPLESSLALTR